MDEMASSSKRLKLHSILLSIVQNVYFQPPGTQQMRYPCIIYDLSGIPTDHADDGRYRARRRYTVTLIDKNPDTKLVEEILKIPYCSFDRFFISDNLNHFVFTIHY